MSKGTHTAAKKTALELFLEEGGKQKCEDLKAGKPVELSGQFLEASFAELVERDKKAEEFPYHTSSRPVEKVAQTD